jgi:hypothetical protein
MVGKIASDREHDQILDLPGAMDIIMLYWGVLITNQQAWNIITI